MRKDKNKIIEMRSSGMSYKAISNNTGISKSTLSKWFKDDFVSDTIKNHLKEINLQESTNRIINLNKTRGNLLSFQYQKAESEARQFLIENSNNSLFTFGIGAYWGEGDKASKNGFRIANSDPEFIKLFIKFLIEVCKVEKEKIRLYLMIYDDLNKEHVLDFWVDKLGVDRTHFARPYVIKGRHKSKKLPFGTCIASVASSYLKRKMNIWLKELPKML